MLQAFASVPFMYVFLSLCPPIIVHPYSTPLPLAFACFGKASSWLWGVNRGPHLIFTPGPPPALLIVLHDHFTFSVRLLSSGGIHTTHDEGIYGDSVYCLICLILCWTGSENKSFTGEKVYCQNTCGVLRKGGTPLWHSICAAWGGNNDSLLEMWCDVWEVVSWLMFDQCSSILASGRKQH